MVGGSFLSLVLVLFLVFQVDTSAKGLLILVNYQYGDCHSSQTPPTQEGCCTQSLASPSTRYHQAIQGETFKHFCNSPGTSLTRSGFPSQAGHSNVGRYQDSVAMQILQTAAQTERTVLPDLSSTLAECDRLVLCAWDKANHTGTRSTTMQPHGNLSQIGLNGNSPRATEDGRHHQGNVPRVPKATRPPRTRGIRVNQCSSRCCL